MPRWPTGTPSTPDHDVRRTQLRESIRNGLWVIPSDVRARRDRSWASLLRRLDDALDDERPPAAVRR